MQKLVFELQDFVDQIDFQSLRTFLFAGITIFYYDLLNINVLY